MTGPLWGCLGGNNVKLTSVLCLGEGHLFKARKCFRRGKKRFFFFKEKHYFRLQATADAAALANTSALHILKIWTRNASDHWFAIFLIPALLFPYESNSLLSFRVWFDRYCSHFTFVFSSSYTITHWVPCEITIVHFQLSNPFAVQK